MNMARIGLRSIRGEAIFFALAGLCAGTCISILIAILGVAYVRGASRLSLDFLTSPASSSGSEGGILYQILGSLLLISTTVVCVTPPAICLAITETTVRRPKMKQGMRSILHILNATPSIIFGILGYLFFVQLCQWDKSWLAGGMILALMILPTVTMSLMNRIATIPKGYTETAKALGLNDDQLIRSVILPYGYGGLLTGIVMGIARAAGETAPIMFTAVVFSGASIPNGVQDNPVLALPYHIFNLAQDIAGPSAASGAWATAFVLIVFVLLLSVAIAPLRSRSHEEAKTA